MKPWKSLAVGTVIGLGAGLAVAYLVYREAEIATNFLTQSMYDSTAQRAKLNLRLQKSLTDGDVESARRLANIELDGYEHLLCGYDAPSSGIGSQSIPEARALIATYRETAQRPKLCKVE